MVFDHQGRVLLVWHLGYEQWCLPGGHVEDGETLTETAVREVREETGVTIEIMNGGIPLVVADIDHPGKPAAGEDPHRHQDTCYLARADSAGDLHPQTTEVAAAEWIHWTDLDTRPNVRSTVGEHLRLAFAAAGQWPTQS